MAFAWLSRRKAVEDAQLSARVDQLTEDVGEVVAELQRLRMEWTDTLDKINHWAARQRSRDRASLAKLAEESHSEGEPAQMAEPMTPAQSRMAAKAALRARLRA